jgi:hypothetical protein
MITINEVLELLISKEFRNEISDFKIQEIKDELEMQIICNLQKRGFSWEDSFIQSSILFEKNEEKIIVTIQAVIDHYLDSDS